MVPDTVRPEDKAKSAPTFDWKLLSPRETQVLKLACKGRTDAQIALALGVRPATVSSYWFRIREKLGHLSRTEFVAEVLKGKIAEASTLDHRRIERLRAENRTLRLALRAALDLCTSPTALVDRDGCVATANRPFLRRFDVPTGVKGVSLDQAVQGMSQEERLETFYADESLQIVRIRS
jgi:DNA-binding CsgD family transcriptional regulator